jgi:glycine cleavage system H protein
MSDLVFMMGRYGARFPTDRLYCSNHMWAQRVGERHRFGFSAYAERLLRDVYFLEWILEAGVVVHSQQQIGTIESKKAESDLYAPVTGQLVRFNEAVMDDPSAINTDQYGSGWLFEMVLQSGTLLSPEDYLAHLASVWETTRRVLQGQLNASLQDDSARCGQGSAQNAKPDRFAVERGHTSPKGPGTD